MKRYYEESLPEGYSEAFAVDANDKKTDMRLQVAAMITVAVLINVFFFIYALPRLGRIADGFTILKCAAFVIAYPLYIVGLVIFGLSVVMTLVSGIHYIIVNRAALKEDDK